MIVLYALYSSHILFCHYIMATGQQHDGKNCGWKCIVNPCISGIDVFFEKHQDGRWSQD